MTRTVVAAALGVFVLGAGLVSYVYASKTCNPHACKAVITANCEGLKGRDRAQCAHGIVDECNSGTITCVASPSAAFIG